MEQTFSLKHKYIFMHKQINNYRVNRTINLKVRWHLSGAKIAIQLHLLSPHAAQSIDMFHWAMSIQ